MNRILFNRKVWILKQITFATSFGLWSSLVLCTVSNNPSRMFHIFLDCSDFEPCVV